MKLEEISSRVEEIRAKAEDEEAAHGKEDSLRNDFIEYISKRKDSLGEKAKLILSTNKIKFPRWRG